MVLAPCVARALFGEVSLKAFGVTCLLTSAPKSVWRAAAETGFKGIAVRFLKKMLVARDVWNQLPPKERPGTTLAMVSMLVKHVNPTISNEELKEILLMRAGLGAGAQRSLLLQGENFDHVAETLSKNDHDVLKAHQKDETGTKGLKVSSLRYLKENKFLDDESFDFHCRRLGVAKERIGKPQTTKQIWKGEWTFQEKFLKKHIPSNCGASISQVSGAAGELWTARYPNALGQKSLSRSFGGKTGRSNETAASIVFRWLWMTHTECTQEECPYPLDELLKV